MNNAPIPVLLMVRELGIGGCERDLAKLSKKLDRDRFEPHVGCFRSEGLRTAEVRAANVPIVEFPVRSFASWGTISAARVMGRYLKQHKIQVVHCFDVPTVLFGVPTARLYQTPAIVSCQLGARNLVSSGTQRALRLTDPMASVVVANSEELRQSLIKNDNIPEERTYLCYNGVETETFYPARVPRPPAVAGASVVIGAVCALRPEKRIDLLIRAFAKVKQLQPTVKLLLVGSGPMLSELQALRDTLSLGDSVVFESATQDVPPWLRAIDIFVLCSESESFPNALLEAMACGCAVIGSRVGGVPELLADEDAGTLFESGNVDQLAQALTKLVTDQPLRESFSRNAAIRAKEHFSMEVNARRNEHLYRRLLASSDSDRD